MKDYTRSSTRKNFLLTYFSSLKGGIITLKSSCSKLCFSAFKLDSCQNLLHQIRSYIESSSFHLEKKKAVYRSESSLLQFLSKASRHTTQPMKSLPTIPRPKSVIPTAVLHSENWPKNASYSTVPSRKVWNLRGGF